MGEAARMRGSLESKLDALYRLGQTLVLLRDERQIMEAVLEIAEEVLDLQDSEFLLMDEATGELVVVAQRGELYLASGLRLPLDGARGITVAAARAGEAVYVPDVRQDPRYVDAGFPARSELAVPVQIEGRLLGVINVESREVDAYSHADAQLLSTLASQAALALENARLYGRERRRVEEMAAVNRVARRVSATLDLQETLDAVVGAAAELVPCTVAEISLWDAGQQMLVLQVVRSTVQEMLPVGEIYPPGEGYTGRVVRHKRPLLVPDVDAREDIQPDLLPGERPFKAYIGLPLLAGEDLIGTLVLVHDEAGAFDAEDLRLLEALGGQASVAIRNARLYEELARRHRELAALYTVAEVTNRRLGLQELLQRVLDRVIEVTHAAGGAIRLLDPSVQEVVLAAHQGLSEAYVRAAGRIPLGEEIVGWVVRSGEPTLSEDMWTDPRVAPGSLELLREVGHRSLVQVPLRVQERVVGTLGVAARMPGFFDQDDLRLLNAIGQHLAVAIDNARLAQEALEAERLAAVGRVAGAVAHDLRGPLGGIVRSAELLARPELSDATRQKLSGAIVATARRLINTAQEILDYTRGGRMALNRVSCDLSAFLDQVLEVLRADFSDRGIEVEVNFQYRGPAQLDPDRMAQVVYNVAANARDAMPDGGWLTVSTRQAAQWLELRFADTGPGVPPDLVGRIFEPFFSHGKREGAGLGLSIARRIVEEHGGQIGVESPASGGATFVVRLPLDR
jgi:GAF domain-containing protein